MPSVQFKEWNTPLMAKGDPKGRLTIPRRIHKELRIEPGDTFFVEADGENAVLRYAKAENPFDTLARHALEAYRFGRTRDLRAFAAENGIDLESTATPPSS